MVRDIQTAIRERMRARGLQDRPQVDRSAEEVASELENHHRVISAVATLLHTGEEVIEVNVDEFVDVNFMDTVYVNGFLIEGLESRTDDVVYVRLERIDST